MNDEILKRIVNISVKPRVYYGLHMVAGVAEYREPKQDPHRIYLNEEVIKNMDASFRGCPVYVQHVDEVDLKDISKADGFVVRSFYNSADGKHWAEFIVITDRGIEAVEQKKWKLSNCYLPKYISMPGQNHGVDYQKKVTSAEYEHLAIVPNPRYEESIILTPEQFKAYNEQKEQELLRVANSKGDKKMKFFKREKVENQLDIENTVTTLELSKKEVTIKEACEIADKVLNMHGYANGDHMVKVGEEEMSVNDMCKAYNKMKSSMDEEEEKKNKKKNEDDKNQNMSEEEKAKKNKEDEEKKKKEEEDKKANEEKEKEEKAKNEKHFNALKDAEKNAALKNSIQRIETGEDQVARGKVRYGSGK